MPPTHPATLLMLDPILWHLFYFGLKLERGFPTDISEAKTMCGREECDEARLRNSSDAVCVSFKITIVCPITVTELMGPANTFHHQ